ncbi:glycosyltransferase family 4 protein [Pinirhizobacter sp.]|jgi:glycosyltransferase involved in cell wall biosynthesis|uniref:glycosyltransferase family 4 protein n=1 Tax=Pinirhizobacter sp. TaxID=2950432 RepID=UPI002F41F881
MKIAICSSFVPFVHGGYRNIVEWLAKALRGAGHQVEIVYLPQSEEADQLFTHMAAYRLVDLDAADVVVCFRPQAHLVRHRRKVVWFIHHIRQYYDLWDTEYRGLPDTPKYRGIRSALQELDTQALREAHTIFSNSAVMAQRLMTFNSLASEVLFPPVDEPGRFRHGPTGDEIVCICRMEHHKRQHLLVEGLAHTTTDVRLRLMGRSGSSAFVDNLRELALRLGVDKRVLIDDRWISEEEKIDLLAGCLASAYVPFDEDSYGYPTLEAAHASKPTLTTIDSGGVTEFVRDGIEGLVCAPEAEKIGAAMDKLFLDKKTSLSMGRAAHDRIAELKISWAHVIERLLA